MDCIECGANTLVRETRYSGGGTDMIRRRRICDNGHRFTSYEFAVPDRGKNYSPKAVYEYMQKMVLATSEIRVKK